MTEQERPRTAGLTADEIEESIASHGPKGECANPDLCVAASMLRLAAEDEGRQQAVREAREQLSAASWAKQPLDFHAILDRVAGLNASESLPKPEWYCFIREPHEHDGVASTGPCWRNPMYRDASESPPPHVHSETCGPFFDWCPALRSEQELTAAVEAEIGDASESPPLHDPNCILDDRAHDGPCVGMDASESPDD